MELSLNLAWALLASLLVCLWIHLGPASGNRRRMQVVALAVLVLILFPVISVSDDLVAMQNPAEVDSSLRRDHAAPGCHSIQPATSALLPSSTAEISAEFLSEAAPGNPAIAIQNHPALSAIESRPPPAA